MPQSITIGRAAARGLFAALVVLVIGLRAAFGAVEIVRDPDIEHALDRLAVPLMRSAGLPANIDVLVVRDDSMNAFVINSRTVFIHSGLILRLESAAELQAVIAHELAHIANGHISRRMGNRRAAGAQSAAGLALALALMAAGEAEASRGLALGTSAAAQNLFFSHTRAEEEAADVSGLRYMADAGIDPRAAVTVLERFRGQELLSAPRRDPYVQTHPLTRDRLRAVEGRATGMRVAGLDRAGDDYWFARAQGKLRAFIRAPQQVLRRVGGGGGEIARLQRAVAYHRLPDPARARAEIDRLVADRPDDPYLHELRGQILLESRDVPGAVAAYRRAAEIQPDHPLILAGLGRAELAAGRTRAAIDTLERARGRDPNMPGTLRDLAQAYAKEGNNGMASLATAERYAIGGRLKDAAIHATRAMGLLPEGSTGYRRAADVADAARRAGLER